MKKCKKHANIAVWANVKTTTTTAVRSSVALIMVPQSMTQHRCPILYGHLGLVHMVRIINNVIYMLFEVMWEKKQMISKAQCSPGPQNTMETQAMASKLGSYQYTPPSSSPEHT